MSHFSPPGTNTAHYIFGPPTPFRNACKELELDVLAEIETVPTVSSRGDQGWPVVMGVGEADDGADAVRKSFARLAEEVRRRLP